VNVANEVKLFRDTLENTIFGQETKIKTMHRDILELKDTIDQ
jgi:hypothetical protein